MKDNKVEENKVVKNKIKEIKDWEKLLFYN